MSAILDKFRKYLPKDQSQESNNKRNAVWEKWDTTLHNFLSLRDIEEGIKRLFDLDSSQNISLVIQKAYKRLRQTLNVESRFGSNYLEKKEFRLFVQILSKLLERMLIFQHFDCNKNNKIGYQDLRKVSKVFEKWSLGDQKHVEICELSMGNNLDLTNFMDWIQSVDYYSLNDIK